MWCSLAAVDFLKGAHSRIRNRENKRERERESVRERGTIASTSSGLKQSVPMYGPLVVSDDIELDAQVPAEVSPGAGQRHLEASLLHVQELRFQGDGIYRGDRLSEREGE